MASTFHNITSDIKTILNVTIFVEPHRVDEFFRHFQPVYQSVIAEPQCRYFVVGENAQNPGELSWSERWTEDVTWLMENQLTKPYYKPYIEATEPMFIKERIIQLCTPKAPFNDFKTPIPR